MPDFVQKLTHAADSKFEIYVYEVDTTNLDQTAKLEKYLTDKVKKIRIFNQLDDVVEMFKVPPIDQQFTNEFKEKLKRICNPDQHKISAFDVRRSYVTEFMSQLLLERKYNCVFYDEVDRRLNSDAISINKHSPGVDVVGVQSDAETIKFVVCEVKASKSAIPCTETSSLLKDIQKSKDLSTNRIAKEILNYVTAIDSSASDELLTKIAEFLIGILHKQEDEDFVLSNVIFFPFLIRNNKDIVANRDLRDFDLFNNEDLGKTVIKGLIWSFNEDIDTFCQKIWDEALTNV